MRFSFNVYAAGVLNASGVGCAFSVSLPSKRITVPVILPTPLMEQVCQKHHPVSLLASSIDL